ncbi:MAG: heat-inducible transcriptional repressor HrcA [Acidobacteriota bacterium]
MTAKDTHPLADRSRRILATLVCEHIDTGEPVASQVLARRGFRLSSATIRNVLASLEELGYLHQPHTSAGRVPTALGYRAYVDMILERRRQGRAAAGIEAQLLEQLGPLAGADAVLTQVPHVLSEVSHQVAFVLVPPGDSLALRHIDLVPIGDNRVLVILVSQDSQVTHKVVEVVEPLTTGDLTQAANYLNHEFAGMTLAEIRAVIVERLGRDRVLYDRLMARALRLAQSTFAGVSGQPTLFVEGASSLFGEVSGPHGSLTLTALGVLVKMIEDKHRLVQLLTQYIDGPGLTIVIGAEHADPNLHEFSLVASTYSDGRGTGTVGLIGPLRMRYSRVISVVNGTAEIVSRMLADSSTTGARPGS